MLFSPRRTQSNNNNNHGMAWRGTARQNLLKTDSVPHEIVPVSGYPDLAKANEEYIEGSEQVCTLLPGAFFNLDILVVRYTQSTAHTIDTLHLPLQLRRFGGPG
jgi:hypothetical protein